MDLMVSLEIQLCQERYRDVKVAINDIHVGLGFCDRIDDLVPARHLVSCLHLGHNPVTRLVLCRCCTGPGV